MKTEKQLKDKIEKLLADAEENDWRCDLNPTGKGYNTYDTSAIVAALQWVLL